jgi:hypothetical protein
MPVSRSTVYTYVDVWTIIAETHLKMFMDEEAMAQGLVMTK